MDQEKQFLLSQQARLSTIERTQRIHHAEELHTFWSILRTKLGEWQDRLDKISKEGTDGDKNNEGKQLLQDLVDMKEQLQQYQKHCLSSTPIIDDWQIPENLPLADIRLLHKEFSTCVSKWELVKEKISPKGKFSFRRYRQEVARRKACGIPLFATPTTIQTTTAATSKPTKQLKTIPQEYSDGSCIQDLFNATIDIDVDGNVLVNKTVFDNMPKVSAAALLIRKLENCSLTIAKPLVTLHIVQANCTKIFVQGDSLRAIHVTDCHNGSSIHACAQQLRLHESTDLTCTVDLAAGAILEDCTRLVFCNTSTTAAGNSLEVKDFNWLRTGIPSPNFKIIQAEPMITTQQESDDIKEIENDLVTIETPIVETAIPTPIDSKENLSEQEPVPIVEDEDDDDEL